MKNNTHLFLLIPNLLIILVFSSTSVFAQGSDLAPWDLVKEEGDLKVYTRKNLDSGIKELRMTTSIRASLEDYIDALNDADSYKDWVYKCESSSLVLKVSDTELYYQIETDFPFPLSDRDLVVHTKQRIDENGTFYSNSVAAPDKRPEENGVVRINMYESHWKATPQNDGSVYIDYNSKVDPAGNIPQWVVNLGITVGPVKSMESFTQFVEEWILTK